MSGRGLQTRVVLVSALVALVVPTAASAHGTPSQRAHADASVARGLVFRDLVRAPADHPCAGAFLVPARTGRDTCSHGPDPAPPGRDVRRRRSLDELRLETRRHAAELTAATAAAVSSGAVHCIGDGTSGNRVQAIYAYPAGSGDRYGSVAPLIAEWAADVDGIVETSAGETGGERHVRWVTDGCELVVDKVQISLPARGDFGTMASELAAKGYDDPARKYLVWVDANVYCGIASLYVDDRKAADNYNNGHPAVDGMVARVDNGCWGYAETHELVHNLGGVQDSAPNSSGHGHCTDESDDMCYEDAPGVVMEHVCPPEHEPFLDCNHDDYFSTAPPDGSYLATHWNTADSSFLLGALVDVDPPAVATPTARFRTTVGHSAVPLTVRWAATDASGVASYAVSESVDDGAFAPVPLPRETATSVVRSVRPGHVYRYRVEAADDFGNVGSVEGADLVVDARQESSRAITYRERWARHYASGALARHQRSASSRGARARFRFTGSAIAWVARTGPGNGRGRVIVDGAVVRTVDLWSWSSRPRRVVFSKTWPSAGTHTVSVVANGTRGRPNVDLDAFLVLH